MRINIRRSFKGGNIVSVVDSQPRNNTLQEIVLTSHSVVALEMGHGVEPILLVNVDPLSSNQYEIIEKDGQLFLAFRRKSSRRR